MRLSVCTFILTVSVLVGVAAFPPSAFGANYNWVGGTGDWSVPTNWDPCGVPGCADPTFIWNGGTAQVHGNACAGSINVQSSEISLVSGANLSVALSEIVGFQGGTGTARFIQTGGTNRVTSKDVGGLFLGHQAGSDGRYELSGSAELFARGQEIGHLGSGTFIQTGGKNTITGEGSGGLALGVESGSDGTYELSGSSELYTTWEYVGVTGTGIFIQTGGTNRVNNHLFVGINGTGTFIQTGGMTTVIGEGAGMLILGNETGSDGRYELSGNAEVSAPGEVIGYLGTGTFIQTGGTNIVKNVPTVGDTVLTLGYLQGSQGEYELNGGTLTVEAAIFVGWEGTGTFIQTEGTNNATDLYLGTWESGEGTYNMSGGTFDANEILVAFVGKGSFIQTGGTVTVKEDLTLGDEPGSEGSYNLSETGNLNVACDIEIGSQGTGSFVMDGGTINGSTADAELCVCGSKASLTGPGTFNIEVTYESDDIYGTYGDECVAATFDPCCLTVGGAYDADWTTPENFAGGTVPNLLESSVFVVNFDGVYCGQFELAIPYDQSEVNVCDANELELLVLRETGPETYEQIPIVEIDTYDDVIYAYCNSFGKYAVQVAECNGGGGLCCVPWYLGDLDHDCDVSLDDLYELTDSWLQDDLSVDIFPIGGDGIVNFADFTVLANHWLECTVP